MDVLGPAVVEASGRGLSGLHAVEVLRFGIRGTVVLSMSDGC